jgi:antitoxin component YwqK of YwqJK toxin-antitoxin module
VGENNTYYPDGKLQLSLKYSENGRIEEAFYPGGQAKSVKQFAGNKPLDTWKFYWENGQIQQEIPHEAGLLNGTLTTYYQNGQIESQQDYRKGRKTGTAYTYYPSGQTKSETKYYYGVQQGPYKEFYENGETKVVGEYSGGKKTGAWKHFDAKGNITDEKTYKEGLEVAKQ